MCLRLIGLTLLRVFRLRARYLFSMGCFMGTCRCLLGLYWGEHIGLLMTRAPKKHISKNKDGDIPYINPLILKPKKVGISI